MKVAFNGLLIDNHRTGVGNYGLNLIQALVQESVGKNIDYRFYLQKCIKVDFNDRVIQKSNYKYPAKRLFDEQFLLPFEYRKADVIHYIDYGSAFANLKKPFICTIHDLSFYEHPETYSLPRRMIRALLLPYSLKNAQKIVAVSNHTKNDLIRHFPNIEDKIVIIHSGITPIETTADGKKIAAVKRKFRIQGKYILAVGTLEPRKNIVRTIEAFGILTRKIENLSLVLVGNPGGAYKNVQSAMTQYADKGTIIITGYVNQTDLAHLYRGAKAFVYPSLYEGFGFPPLEAMSCGVPVVVSRSASLPEIVGNAGFYVDPYDVGNIAEGIYQVLSDGLLRQNLITLGRERFRKFTWSKTAKKIIALHQEIKDSIDH